MASKHNEGYLEIKINWNSIILPFDQGMEIVKILTGAEEINMLQNPEGTSLQSKVIQPLSYDIELKLITQAQYDEYKANYGLTKNNQ